MTELSRHLITHINKNFNVPNTSHLCKGWTQTISKCCKLLDSHKNKFNSTETIYTYHFHASQKTTSKKGGQKGFHHVRDFQKKSNMVPLVSTTQLLNSSLYLHWRGMLFFPQKTAISSSFSQELLVKFQFRFSSDKQKTLEGRSMI